MSDFVKKAASKLTKLSDEQLSKIFEMLTSENETFTSIMESLSTGLIVVDGDWKILSINKSAERYLPFSVRPEETSSEKYTIWQMIDDHHISEFLQSSAAKEKTNVSEEFSISTEDKARFITVSVTPLVNKRQCDETDAFDTCIVGSIISVEDITEKRQQEILLHRMESLASLTNLAASVAHEIKNPLGAISIHIQLLQKSIKKARDGDGMLPPENHLEDYLDVVNEEIDNLNKIVLDFLFAVRPVQANMTLSEPNGLVEKIAAFITPEFNSKNVNVELNLCQSAPRILIDEKLFREIIVNLSQNALAAILSKFPADTVEDFSNVNSDSFSSASDNNDAHENDGEHSEKDSSRKGVLTFSSFVKNEKYILTVADNGCGMDQKTLARIFEPYYTTKANGTGLGLTMVYKIVKEFRGDIDVKSIEGRGTMFKITIPVPQKNKKLLESKSGNNSFRKNSSASSRETVADDFFKGEK